MAEKDKSPSDRRPMAPQPSDDRPTEHAPHTDESGRDPAAGRDRPPSNRPRDPNSPWMGGG